MAVVLFDATRLFMRASRTSPTGIDRVTEAYGRWLLGRVDITLVPVCSFGGFLTPLSLRRFRRILEGKRSAAPGAEKYWSMLSAALDEPVAGKTGLRVLPDAGSMGEPWLRYGNFALRTVANWRPRSSRVGELYLNVSHFGLEQPRLLERLAARGVRCVAMVHDLIPIAHPEYCSPSASPWHLRRIEAILDHAGLVICNSRSTAAELADFALTRGKRPPPTRVAPLGLEPVFFERPPVLARHRPYFVCVGTLEPRKNLGLLFTLWRRLAKRMGEATPALVLAGRRGWETEAIVDHLERSPIIRRFVHEVSGLTDEHLARLIAGANALLAPSFSEGFDLPVAEAAAMGTPVIASDIAVHRELARHAQLLDPTDGPAWLAAVETAAMRRLPGPSTTLASWSEHFRIVGEALGLDPPTARPRPSRARAASPGVAAR
jgi:glycosyltransferase involved in cell wall biosynthesis